MPVTSRGLLGASANSSWASTNPAGISWPAPNSSSFSWSGASTGGFANPSGTSCASEAASQAERRVKSGGGAVETSGALSAASAKSQGARGSACSGSSLERVWGCLRNSNSSAGLLHPSSIPTRSTSRATCGLHRGSQVSKNFDRTNDCFLAWASISPHLIGAQAGGSGEGPICSGALQCRSMNGGLLALPSLTQKLKSSWKERRSLSLRHKAGSVERSGMSVGCHVRALGRGGQDLADKGKTRPDIGETADLQALEGKWHTDLNSNQGTDQSEASWEQISMVFRVVYAIAMYGGLAFAGNTICSFTGVDSWGGFDLSPEVITTGFGYAVPPMMVLLFILEDEIVKNCAPARAIRDVEDEELMDFFVGMSPWQFPFVVAAGALAEELFFRVAIQGGLAHALQISDKGVNETTVGIAALTGMIPLFVPFAQVFAAVLTAALTGSMYYVISSPKDPKYVVAPVIRGHNNRRDIKERVEAWYERRQQKKIYSPLMEALLALYLGFEWMHTGNILAPMITHTLYSMVIVGNGLRRIHDNREKLRQRVNKLTGQRLATVGVRDVAPEKSK